jgi:urease accessory protein
MNFPAAQFASPKKIHEGSGQLEVEFVAGQSAVTSLFSSNPLKILAPQSRGQSVWAYTSSFGGGLVAGDQTRFNIRVGENARCFVSTQSSTKIYRNPNSRPCSHSTRAKLETNSLLVFAPDPVQAFANSSYTQRQEFRLANGAGLVLLDWFTSGRAANGERWAFAKLQSRNDVFIEGGRAVVDSILLDSESEPLDSPHRTGRFNCFAMLLLIGEPLRNVAADLLNEISSRPIERGAALVCSAGPVQNGAMLRMAGESVENVSGELKRHLHFAAELLGDNPWARKW